MEPRGPEYLEKRDARGSLTGSLEDAATQEALTTPTTGEKLAATFQTFVPGMAGAASEGTIWSPEYWFQDTKFDKASKEAREVVESVPEQDRMSVYEQGSLYAMKKKANAIKTINSANAITAKMSLPETLLYSTMVMPFDPTLYVGAGVYSRVNAMRKIANTSRKAVVAQDAALAGAENALSEGLVQGFTTEDIAPIGIAFGTGLLLGGGVSGAGNLIGHWSAPSAQKKAFVKDAETADSIHKPTVEEEINWVKDENLRTEDFTDPDRIEIGGSTSARVINKIFGWKITLSPNAQIQKLAYEAKPDSDGYASKRLAALEATKYDTQTFRVSDKNNEVDIAGKENVSDIQYALAGFIGEADMYKSFGYKEYLEEMERYHPDEPMPTLYDFEKKLESYRMDAEGRYNLAKETNKIEILKDEAAMEKLRADIEKEIFDTEVDAEGVVTYKDKRMQEIEPFDPERSATTKMEEVDGEIVTTESTLNKTELQEQYLDSVMNQEVNKLARDMTPSPDISMMPASIQKALMANNQYSARMAEYARASGVDPRGSWDPEMYGHRMYDKEFMATADILEMIDDFTEAILSGAEIRAKGEYVPLTYREVKGTKGMARRGSDGVPELSPDITTKKILEYLKFDKRKKSTPDRYTAEQKRYVTDYMNAKYGGNFIKRVAKMSDEEARDFLVLHELEHNKQVEAFGGDKEFREAYFGGSRDFAAKGNAENKYLTDKAIELEAEANFNAIAALDARIKIQIEARKQAALLVDTIRNSTNMRDMLFSKETLTPSPLRKRNYSLDSSKIEKYLNMNGSEVRQGYHYKMKGTIATQKMFGTSDVNKYMDNLDPRIVGEERKLLRTMFETALGTRQIPSDPGNAYKNIARDIKSFNYLTDAGGFAKYAVSELGVAAAKLGFNNVVKEFPAAAKMIQDMYTVKNINANTPEAARARDVIRAADGYDIFTGMNRSALGDHSDADSMIRSGYNNKVIRTVSEKGRELQETMFKFSGLEGATVFSKIILPRAFMGRLFDNIAAGKNVSESLKRWGMTKQDIDGIKKVLDEKGWDKDKFQDYDFAGWEDQQLAHKVQRMIGRMSRDVILRHESLRLPSWMTDGDSSAIIDLTKQFMSFSMMSYDKLLLAGLNDNKAMAAVGMIGSGAILGAFAHIEEEILVATGVKDHEKAVLPYNENAGQFFRRLAIRQSYASLPGNAMELAGFSEMNGGMFTGNFTSSGSDVSRFMGGPALANVIQLSREGGQFFGDPSIKEGLDIAKAIAPMNNLIWYDWSVRAGIAATGE